MKKRRVVIAAAVLIAAACLLFYGYRLMQPDRPAAIAGTWLSEETRGSGTYETTVRFNRSGSGQKIVRTRRATRAGRGAAGGRTAPGVGAVEEASDRANIVWGIRDNLFYIDDSPWNWKLSEDGRVLVLSNGPPFNYTWTLNRQ